MGTHQWTMHGLSWDAVDDESGKVGQEMEALAGGWPPIRAANLVECNHEGRLPAGSGVTPGRRECVE